MKRIFGMLIVLLLTASPARGQIASANLQGTVRDATGAVLPGVSVTARNVDTGYTRAVATLPTGAYVFASLPLGPYQLTFELSGFQTVTLSGLVLTVGATVVRDAVLATVTAAETVTVTAEAPLVDTASAHVQTTVQQVQVQNLPLNGRQFANLAVLVPGVSLGTNPDPTHINNSAAQIGGGRGRFTNNYMDGGDNNDDVVGGQLQGYSLEAIQEFQIITQQFKAEYGRAAQGVVNVVTRSGTNDLKGSFVALFRDDDLNGRTESENRAGLEKAAYSREQFAGSLGGRLLRDRAFFFVAAERLQQDRELLVNTFGLAPEEEGLFPLPLRDNNLLAKFNWQISPNHSLMLRYGRQTQSDVFGTSTISPPSSWADNENSFNSVLVNLKSLFGSTKLNELVFQWNNFENGIVARVTGPSFFFPSGTTIGPNSSTPQTTFEKKFQFRDDLSWTATGKGTHNLKTGVNFIYEPTANGTFNVQTARQYTFLQDRRDSPIESIFFLIGDGSFDLGAQELLGLYFQDDWQASASLTVNLGVRYDFYSGMAYEQSNNGTFQFIKTVRPEFDEEFKNPKTNVQPRLGFAWSPSEDRKTAVRGGYGYFVDYNILTNFFGLLANSHDPQRLGYFAFDGSGLKNPAGSFLTPDDPLPPNQVNPEELPTPDAFTDPNQVNPRYHHFSLGVSREINPSTSLDINFVYVIGRHTGMSDFINRFPGPGQPRPHAAAGYDFPIRVEQTEGRNRYRALDLSLRRRFQGWLQLHAWYTLSSAQSTDVRGTDELLVSFPQREGRIDDDVNFGPTTQDATHRAVISGIFSLPAGFQITYLSRYLSGRPYDIRAGVDLNGDGIRNDLPPEARHINDARGDSFFQADVRASKFVELGKNARLEGFIQIFNLFNNENPFSYNGTKTAANFGQPRSFAGDLPSVGGFEQRLAEIGFRVEF